MKRAPGAAQSREPGALAKAQPIGFAGSPVEMPVAAAALAAGSCALGP